MKKDRYTRLKAINEFGYDVEWERLQQFHVGIIGIGGLGVVSSEMCARCGIGTISLFDFDEVDVVNLNRMMFRSEHVGRPKVVVASEILNEINPDVSVRNFQNDIMDPDFESIFNEELKKIDIILTGLDNIPARDYLNTKCIRLKVPYIDAGAARSGLSGYVHPVIPYKTACAKCLSSIGIDLPDEKGEPCVASLPSTMAILASIQVQEMLKYLLKFGELIDYLMYNMVKGNFLEYQTKRDKVCPICGSKDNEDKEGKVEPEISEKELDDYIKDMEEDEI